MRGTRPKAVLSILVLVAALAPCGASGKEEPKEVVVQHILIGFKRSVPGKKLARTRREAKALAEDLLRRARAGEDFDALVEQYSDDRAPGILRLVNTGEPESAGKRPRDSVVPRFGDVAFSLEVGQVGLAEHHAALSPYGYHVIKRLE